MSGDGGPIIVLLVLMLVAIVAIAARGRQDTRDKSEQPTRRNYEGKKVVKVFTLGTSGSGKTCFMASLFNRLRSMSQDTGFYLSVSPDRQNKLVRLYDAIADPKSGWPAGTTNEKEWIFSIQVPSVRGNESFHAFDFSYLDYAGGSLTDADRAAAFGVRQHVSEADAILVLIDGLKVFRRLVRNEHDAPRERLKADLDDLVPFLNDVGGKPVHIIVTKWDLVAPHYKLKDVRACLLEHHAFKSLVIRRTEGQIPTRLIPVSAVGHGFAHIDSRGNMIKDPNCLAFPLYVEVSMAATLSDAFEALVSGLRPEERTALHTVAHGTVTERDRAWHWLIDTSSRMLAHLPFPGNILSEIGPAVRDFLAARKKSVQQLRHEFLAAVGCVRDKESAIRAVLASHKSLMRAFEAEHPDSVLASGNLD